MKVWMGHYKGDTREWFLCWGNTKAEAIEYVDDEGGQPDLDSVQPLEGAGMIQFLATPADPRSADADDLPLAKLSFIPDREPLDPDYPRLDNDDWERITVTLAATRPVTAPKAALGRVA